MYLLYSAYDRVRTVVYIVNKEVSNDHDSNIVKISKKTGIIALLLPLFVAVPVAFAATSPGLGMAGTFVILSGSYINTTPGTTLVGDLGYTTGPAVAPTISGNTHVADSIYNQAGIDQGSALNNLNNQVCSFNFAPGPIDLASDTTHGPVGVYTPGVYCITGDASVGGGGTMTLNGAGAYVFRMDGALTTSANSVVTLINGASACDTWWTPTQATTLGANTTFAGTNIDASGITIGSNTTWVGSALAFGGTVTTDSDTISAPICGASRTTTTSVATTPGLPNTGVKAQSSSILWATLSVLAVTVVSVIYFVRKKA